MILLDVLIFLSFVAIFLEFYLPGAIMATLGALLALTAIWIAWGIDARMAIGVVVIEIVGAIFVSIAAFKLLKRHRIRHTQDQKGYRSSEFDLLAIGKEGVVIKDLRPSGFIEVGGSIYQASSKGEYIKKGSRVTIVDGEGSRVIVR